ncbi:UNVERIFIED_CONTAM: hypothetical protein Slati_2950900 [Sesamum latifolium]|uniref:Uncharacterized protein n=1 Tax=Sesamum latifolium TaxID=2727402 RepID=A0AAW2VER2_9LAMI
MEDFSVCLRNTGLLHVPMQGDTYTWHNCSDGARSLWKRLDRMLANEQCLSAWPNTMCLSSTPRTSDHSPLVIRGYSPPISGRLFRFDNYLAKQPGFLHLVTRVLQQHIVGTPMYAITQKLKALKPVFRAQRKVKGDLAENVKLAKDFLNIVQRLLSLDKHNSLPLIERMARALLMKASKIHLSMLQQ